MGAIAAGGSSLYAVLYGVGAQSPGWIGAVGTYSFGNAVATLSSLPGGLGANEDVSTAVLSHMGLDPGVGAAGVLIFRATTLFLGTALGWMALLGCQRRFNIKPSLGGLQEAIKRSEHEAAAGDEPSQRGRDPAVASLKQQ